MAQIGMVILNIISGTCGAYGILEPRDFYTDGKREFIRQRLSAWLKKRNSCYPLGTCQNPFIPGIYQC